MHFVLDLLSTALVSALVLLVPASGMVLAVRRDQTRPPSDSSASVTMYRIVLVAMAVSLGALLVGVTLGAGPVGSAGAVVVTGLSVLVWAPMLRRWTAPGVVVWALAVDAGVGYLAYVTVWTVTAEPPLPGLLASLALGLAEAVVVAVALVHVWQFVDVRARRVPAASVTAPILGDRTFQPIVSLHVPIFDEPPDRVIGTLSRLVELDYGAYEIVVVNSGGADPARWGPVEAFCAGYDGITFRRVENGVGIKGAALNRALEHTDPRVEVIGVVDVDQLVHPDFLRDCVPKLADPSVVFVQTPRDYREWEDDAYSRRLYYAYGEFFHPSQQSVAERDGVMLGDAVSLVRRSALESVGGWDECCLAEEAELSLRLCRTGGRGVRVDWSYGHGVLPPTFEALKRQRQRWGFGGGQILRQHGRTLLPGRGGLDALTPTQRWAYLVGRPAWFGGLASVLLTGLLLVSAMDVIVGSGAVARRGSGLLTLGAVVVLAQAARPALARIRRRSHAGWSELAGAFGLRMAVSWATARGAVHGLVARPGVLPRLPGRRAEPRGRSHATRHNTAETALALLCAGFGLVALTRLSWEALLVGVMLLAQAFGFLLAPLYSRAAITGDNSEETYRPGALSKYAGLLVPLGGLALATVVVLALAVLVIFAIPSLDSDSAAPRDGRSMSADGSDSSTDRPLASAPTDRPDRNDHPRTGDPAPSEPETTRSTEPPTATSEAPTTPTAEPTTEPTKSPGKPDKPPGKPDEPPGKPDKPDDKH